MVERPSQTSRKGTDHRLGVAVVRTDILGASERGLRQGGFLGLTVWTVRGFGQPVRIFPSGGARANVRRAIQARVLEVACGKRRDFPYIERRIGPAGRPVHLRCPAVGRPRE